jgi:hypothetical protein
LIDEDRIHAADAIKGNVPPNVPLAAVTSNQDHHRHYDDDERLPLRPKSDFFISYVTTHPYSFYRE